ncbi:MAG TPA: membrane dipeptidase [Candidatus Dormibacteraeota bacterium]|nr:membrane dipeptidase [Candidatus Dormibacteraeota bacterium]
MIVDGHLDIAWNALAHGHRFDAPPARGHLVSRPALEAAGVGIVCCTIFCPPSGWARSNGFAYATPREAYLIARAQLGYYRSAGLPLIRDRRDLDRHLRRWPRGGLAGVLLMEGADPIESPAQMAWWAGQGVRIVGPAWGRTRYAGSTSEPGGLTPAGMELLRAMRATGTILDVSHLADQALAESLALWDGPIVASHSNARALVPGDRQLEDRTVREIAARGGMIGVSFYGGHLRVDGRRPRLQDVVRQVEHLASVAGSAEHVGLGTDLDGGFSAAQAPLRRLEQIGELRRLLLQRFTKRETEGILGANWIEFLRRNLAVSKEGS